MKIEVKVGNIEYSAYYEVDYKEYKRQKRKTCKCGIKYLEAVKIRVRLTELYNATTMIKQSLKTKTARKARKIIQEKLDKERSVCSLCNDERAAELMGR